jgi:hypothetical protein
MTPEQGALVRISFGKAAPIADQALAVATASA